MPRDRVDVTSLLRGPSGSRRSVCRGTALFGLSGQFIAALSACAAIEDRAFTSGVIRVLDDDIHLSEDDGTVFLEFELQRPADRLVTATVLLRGIEAQQDCVHPDYRVIETRLRWPEGETKATLQFDVVDDEVPEIDERVEVSFLDVEGAELEGSPTLEIVIADDDRTALVQASDYDVTPDIGEDQTTVLQASLAAAAASGRGVVQLEPGEYFVSSLSVAPGTALVGYGATLLRPNNAEPSTITLRVDHAAETDSTPTLVAGLTIDGRRDEQGPFQALELQDAHLLYLGGDASQPGRVRAFVDAVTFRNATADGLAVGPNADVEACQLVAEDVYREGVSVHGGNTRFSLQGLRASATLGTTGIWLDGDTLGFQDSRTVDVTLLDVTLSSGDFEVSIAEGSNLEMNRFHMEAGPFRLRAPQSVVRITDSELQLGTPSERHNHWDSPDDVEVTRTTIVTSETVDEDSEIEEADREWSAISVIWAPLAAEVPPTSILLFRDCVFQTADDVESTDVVHLLESTTEGGRLVVINGDNTNCQCDWMAPTCIGCEVAR